MTAPAKPRRNLRFALRVLGLLAWGFGSLAALLIVAATAAYFALPKLIDGERVKTMIEAQLQKTLRRPVSIDNVFMTPQGVKLAKFKLMEADGRAAFIECDTALVTVNLPALLEKRLELSRVRLVNPNIRVSRDEEGSWSFSDIFRSTQTAEAPAKPLELPVTLASDETAIENGRLEIDDRLRGRHFLVEKFYLAVERFDTEASFPYKISFDTVSTIRGKQVNNSLSAEGEAFLAGFDWAQASLKADKARVKVEGRDISGTFKALGLPPSEVEAQAKLPPMSPQDWEYWLGKPLDLTVPESEWTLKGRRLESGKYAADSVTFKAGPLSGRAAGSVDLASELPSLSGEVAVDDFPLDQAAPAYPPLGRFELKGLARGEAAASGWAGRWKIAKAHVRLKDLEARFKQWRVKKGDADLTTTDDFAKLAVTLSSGAVEAFKNEFADITLSLRLVKTDLSVDYLAFRWGDSHARGKGRVVNLPDPRDVWLTGTVDQLRWEKAQKLVDDVLASISTRTVQGVYSGVDDEGEPRKLWLKTFKYSIPRKFPDTMGHLRVGRVQHNNFSLSELALLWDLRGVTNKLDNVSGEVRATLGPGRVYDIQAVQDSHKFLKIVFLPYIYMHKMNNLSVLSADTAYPKTLDFSRIEGQYGVRKGVVDTRFFDVDSPQLVAYADGSADLGRENVDMNILTRLTSYRAPLPEWWVDEKGRPAIGFRVKGDINRPDLEPRLTKIAADEIERTLDEARRRAKTRFEAIEKLRLLDGASGPAIADKDNKKGAKK